jgi:hypothetical protein
MNAEQLKIIAENSPREAAKILNIHIRNVRYHKQRMEGKSVKQLKQPKTNYKWTEEEDNYLLTFGNDSTYPELEETLKASRIQIDHRCKTLGVSPKKLKHHKILTEEEKEICLQGYLHQAAEKLGVSIPTAGRRRRELLKIDFRRCDTRTPVSYILKEEKAKIGINEILSQFPEMTVGQIHQTKLIHSYSPKSAVRYCEVIREYAKNRAAYSPARIKNDR